jgi:ArsR family transcriptional regulator
MPPAALSVAPLSALFRALGDETRLRIVALLSHGELCVCHIQAALGLSQPAASRHLGVLKAARIVEPRREGSWIHYRLARQDDPGRSRQLRALVGAFSRQELLQRDVARLVLTRGPRSCR